MPDSAESRARTAGRSALTSLLEPMMIVLMGGVIAFVAFSILMPILQMNSAIK